MTKREPQVFKVKCPVPGCDGTVKLDERTDYGYEGEAVSSTRMACGTCLNEADSDGDMVIWPELRSESSG